MKKIQTLLVMFSLFFLFSFSSAATVTINITEFDGTVNTIVEENSEIDSDVTYTLDLNTIQYVDSTYEYCILYYQKSYKYYLYRPSATIAVTPLGFYNGNYCSYAYAINKDDLTKYGFTCGSFGRSYSSVSQDGTTGTYRFLYSTKDIYMLDCDFVYPYDSENVALGEVYFSSESSSQQPGMVNPLTDEEIKSILEIFLESMASYGLPPDYERFVLTYNVGADSYSGFVYSKYSDLSLKYLEMNIETNFWEYFLDGVGPFYSFFMYKDNRPLSYKINFFNKPQIIEFNSNSDNTAFVFNKIYDLSDHMYSLEDMYGQDDYLVLSTENEPIIYTSDKIQSLIFTGNILGVDEFEEDENTSLTYKEITDEEGNVIDDTVSTIAPEVETNVNILSFFGLLFGFIFSVVSFVIRFFSFMVSFVIIPSSTTILPDGFVQGIDWIHSFAFGDILLWDIFSILFLVLFSIFLVNLIHSH